MASEELALKLQRRLDVEQLSISQTKTAAADVPANTVDVESQRERTAVVNGNATAELTAKLNRRLDIYNGTVKPKQKKVFNPYTEFKEFTRKQMKDMEEMFKRFDSGKDGFIDLMELKMMMQKLGAPQTHLGLKTMIREVDEDYDGKLSYRETITHFFREKHYVVLERATNTARLGGRNILTDVGSFFHTVEVNCGPQSETMSSGSPNCQKMWWKSWSAVSQAVGRPLRGRDLTILENQSTMTKITVLPSDTGCSWMACPHRGMSPHDKTLMEAEWDKGSLVGSADADLLSLSVGPGPSSAAKKQFLLIFRRAAAGELQESGLMALARLSEINVSAEGVQSACDFFEAKAQVLSVRSKFEAELCEEQEEKRRVEEERKQRHVAFKELQSAFCS
ncbi:hypothetical protein P4O66_017929 [Electrophorus voltai]|uniref:EF-hand domain-containing protein n=1 Tax=Electrophorus voltai TaxID=2609070 RepID=A0AAD8YS79_9TELE|nr:hypothetical protein P4O66_017929 [Electrophorus voltai]